MKWTQGNGFELYVATHKYFDLNQYIASIHALRMVEEKRLVPHIDIICLDDFVDELIDYGHTRDPAKPIRLPLLLHAQSGDCSVIEAYSGLEEIADALERFRFLAESPHGN